MIAYKLNKVRTNPIPFRIGIRINSLIEDNKYPFFDLSTLYGFPSNNI